ncbi:Nn.00g073210.m01.CDS01 [Neocucurbitaria sp. VM-36]
MHRKNPISVLVYNTLFPTPSPTDPPSFSAHLSKNLVGEVRIETANFYGSLDTIEARYPGLNYAFGPHRKRLGRFPHHRRLFEAFDRLGLTEAEIQGFCRWEGTLWARERYERDEGVRVVDTTGVEIGEWVDRRRQPKKAQGINVKTDIEVEIEEVPTTTGEPAVPADTRHPTQADDTEMRDSDHDEDSEEDDEEEELSSSVGFSLNARLLHAAALREQANDLSSATNIPMDPEWEQYLKEAQERGELNIDATREALRSMAGQIAQLHQTQVDAESSGSLGMDRQAAAPA